MVAHWCLLTASMAVAQTNQFGGQDRADAAQRLLILAVQQAIDSLPPMAGQAPIYEYDATQDTYLHSKQLGATVLRSPRPIGAGRFSLRVAASYFDLSQSFGPAVYYFEPQNPDVQDKSGFAGFGLQTRAHVGVLSFAANYGFTHWLDAWLVLPVVTLDASATQSFTTRKSQLGLPADQVSVVGSQTRAGLEMQLRHGIYVYRRDSLSGPGFDFNAGTHIGMGRAHVGTRLALWQGKTLRVSFAPELHLPSPSESQFAGSASTSLLSRFLAEAAVLPPLRVLAEMAYDYDFQHAELRRFTASTGLLFAGSEYSVDVGFSASVFDTPLRWTPDRAYGTAGGSYPATVLSVRDPNTVGSNFVDFLAGAKLRLTERLILNAAVTVPVNEEGFRPVALGTLAVDLAY